MWLAQLVCAPQFFKTPSGLCGHPVYLSGDNGIEWDKKKLPEFRCNLPQTACGSLN
jgi:hypothetical protein